ncbi:hypothetical protein F0562_000190 [Nyssa sinensis]|uniref:non-specific serine/threonine protein kinase n=1 Tax=Nyssa sinensis TaxID=561372 RepID=A0A5J5BZA9_9ASTE|nr:hypothetical protein F0562_000190 [Nyssa sinensis]
MLARESAGTPFDLPQDVLEVLPSDPFEQLDVARKITSIALSTRVSTLESETSVLRAKLNDRDAIIADLQAQIESLDASLSETANKLAQADQEKENLLRENDLLSNTVKKLNRDVTKLESFRKTLMQSLQEDEENSAGAPQVVASYIPSHASLSSPSFAGEEDATLPPSRASSIRSQFSEIGNSYAEDPETDASRPRISQGLLLASQSSTPRLTPPGSPPSLSASVSPTRTSKPVSPRWHSMSFSTTRGMSDDSSSAYSMSSGQQSPMSASDTGSQSGRTRVDGKEFFRQVRSRLSYELFGAFLANVKELNSHKQTKEETLRKANEIFGPDNKDLYTTFEGLITRRPWFWFCYLYLKSMENVPEPSDFPCINDSDGELLKIGHRKLFSANSISLSDDDMGEEIVEVSSPRGILEDDPDSESASSKASTSDSEVQPKQKSESQWRGFFRVLKKRPGMGLHTFHPGKPSIKKFSKNKSRNSRQSMPELNSLNPTLDAELYCFKSSWKNFSLSELQTATNNFSHENLIGEGGYSEVYKGHLQDGQLVAIKRLIRGGMHLVLHLSPHGSLASRLTGENEKLEWDIRYKIALGTAEGLSYLHEGCQRRIIHRDIKAANILLTEDFDPQISDFGLSKWLPDQWTHLTVSQFEGTFGYLPPEFFMHGMVDEKTDVYAYGVLLLELITGRLALDKSQQSLLIWAKPLLAKNDIKKLVDPSLAGAYDSEEMNRMLSIASRCMQESSIERPQMSKVVRILKKDGDILDRARKLLKARSFKRIYPAEFLNAEEPNSMVYSNNMIQPMQIALEL